MNQTDTQILIAAGNLCGRYAGELAGQAGRQIHGGSTPPMLRSAARLLAVGQAFMSASDAISAAVREDIALEGGAA